jgi:hypothetical protein
MIHLALWIAAFLFVIWVGFWVLAALKAFFEAIRDAIVRRQPGTRKEKEVERLFKNW